VVYISAAAAAAAVVVAVAVAAAAAVLAVIPLHALQRQLKEQVEEFLRSTFDNYRRWLITTL
jgi:hypothetical protein